MTGINSDDLYGLPFDRFVPERDALARAMRAEGRRKDAAAVAALRKPSVAAWVVNQLVRGNRDGLKSLFDAGDALSEAQTAVIDGRGDGHSLRLAADRERAAVDDLVDAARSLGGAGEFALSDAIIDRIADTLHAAAFDEDAREQVRDGRLQRELRHVGLGGALAGVSPSPVSSQRTTKRQSGVGDRSAARKAGKQDAAAGGRAAKQDKPAKRTKVEARETAKQVEAREAAKEVEAREAGKQAEAEAEAHRAAKRAEAQARQRADRAERALARAEERRERAAQALGEADEAVENARGESEAAADAHREARQRLDGPSSRRAAR